MSSENDIKEMMKMAKAISDVLKSCSVDKNDTEKDIDKKINSLLTAMESTGALTLLEKIGTPIEDKNKEKVD
jgi:hypothetical protein